MCDDYSAPLLHSQHFPASVRVLEYNARMRRQDTANASEYWRANFADDDWPLAVTYSEAADEHDRAVVMLQLAPEMAAAILAWHDMGDSKKRLNYPDGPREAWRKACDDLGAVALKLRALSRETTTEETR